MCMQNDTKRQESKREEFRKQISWVLWRTSPSLESHQNSASGSTPWLRILVSRKRRPDEPRPVYLIFCLIFILFYFFIREAKSTSRGVLENLQLWFHGIVGCIATRGTCQRTFIWVTQLAEREVLYEARQRPPISGGFISRGESLLAGHTR